VNARDPVLEIAAPVGYAPFRLLDLDDPQDEEEEQQQCGGPIKPS